MKDLTNRKLLKVVVVSVRSRSDSDSRDLTLTTPYRFGLVCTENLSPGVMVMKSAQDGA